jgi:hypothetical protein
MSAKIQNDFELLIQIESVVGTQRHEHAAMTMAVFVD